MVDFLAGFYFDPQIHCVTLNFDEIEFIPAAQEHLTVVLCLIFASLVVDFCIFYEYIVSEEDHPAYVDLINVLAYFIPRHLLGFIVCHLVVHVFGSSAPQ